MTLILEPRRAGRAADVVAMSRRPSLAERIVFVDGMPGCGKTLFSAVVSAFDRVEVEKYTAPIEHLCVSWFLGKLADDAAASLVRLLSDIDLYSLMISREANFKLADLSSIFRHPQAWRYLQRLFLPDGDGVVTRIRQERPLLNYVTHNLLPVGDPVLTGLEDRVRIVEVVRHPLYMLKQWFLFIRRYGADVRDFTLWVEAPRSREAVPWFAQGWEERYLRAASMDRVIFCIQHLGRLAEAALARFSPAQQSQVVTIPFEPFVLDPWPWLGVLERALGTQVTAVTRRELRRQRVPRRRIAEGLALKVYRANGWEPSKGGANEAEERRRRREFAAEHASAEGMAVLDELCATYEARYLAGGNA